MINENAGDRSLVGHYAKEVGSRLTVKLLSIFTSNKLV